MPLKTRATGEFSWCGPRRAGKDIAVFNLCIRAALRKIQVIYYIFPTYSQGRKVIFDSITNSGERILDYIPKEIIESQNNQELKIRFKNGSLLQIVGSDNFDALMGTNPQLCVFSEYALQDPRAYQYIRPILTANDGVAIFLSTPRGKNHLWELYNIAQQSDAWFCQKLTVEDTGHISLHEIAKEKAEGIMSDDLIQQEYYTSFTMGVEGSYYSKYLDRMRVRGQIGMVPWENGFKINTAWDLGVRDSTTIIFFQVIGQTIRIVDCYENNKVGLDHYAKVLEQKPYQYGKHIAPHDIKVRELGSGMTRLEKARQLGISFTIAPDLSIEDGIESVRSALSKIWIDEVACKPLINALENYRQEFDVKRKVYKSQPLHDWASHWCFVGDTPILTRSGMRQIMDITENDEVLTIDGWSKCTKAKLTLKDANLVAVAFTDGTIVKCTPDHLFLTVNGWKSAESLEKGTRIQSFLMDSYNTLMGIYTECGRLRDTFLKEDPPCTALCGQMLMAIYRIIATFTTEIPIHPTMHYGILSACPRKNISDCVGQIIKDLQTKQETRLLPGMLQMLEDCGIKDMLLEVLHGLNGRVNRENAPIVVRNLVALLERMAMNRNFAIQTVKHLFIESVEKLDEKSDVWDITVPWDYSRVPYDFQSRPFFGGGQFSLSNGAIVHNSDSMRYLCISLPKMRDGASPEDIDKRYREAMYGTNNNLPSVFRDDHF